MNLTGRLSRFRRGGLPILALVTLALLAGSGRLQAAEGSSWHPTTMTEALLATLAFGLVGIALCIGGFKLFDLFIRFNLEREICENRNVAVAILCAAMILGIAIIVAAAMG